MHGRSARQPRSAGVVQWRFTVFVVLALLIGGLVLTPETSHAKAQQHYRAVFVAESSLPVSGKAEIQVDANGVAHIVIQVSGLLPGATFPAHIHEGASIDDPGEILVELPDLVSNAAGKATVVASVPNADELDLANRTIGVHLSDNTRIAKGEIE